jgi:mycothiol synthase
VSRFEFRATTEADAQRVADLIRAFDSAFNDDPEQTSAQDVVDWWLREGESRLVLEEGELVGYAFLQHRNGRYDGDGYVHPCAFGRGVGAAIVDWVVDRARELGSPETRLAVVGNDDRAACLLRSRGFARIRSFFRMIVDLDEEPPPVEWPAGFTVSALAPGEERLLHETAEDAFEDHWEHTPRSFEQWLAVRRLEPELTFIVRARDGDAAAAAICLREQFGMGWVNVIGTRRAYRRRGLGAALLRHSFRELYRRGARRIGLGVDAENPTGATRLYERAGMRIAYRADVYARRL